MSNPTMVLLVRFKSRLSHDELMKVAESRMGEFRELRGLQQKYYLDDPITGEVAGLYLWESKEALNDYNESELRASIGAAYQVVGAPRVEVYRVQEALRE